MPIGKGMDPIQGTNNSLAMALIAARYLGDAQQLSTAKAGMTLDMVKETGELVVQLIEGIGENIDLYA